jgi:hypothetical protein
MMISRRISPLRAGRFLRPMSSMMRRSGLRRSPHGVFHLQAKALARVFVENHQPFQSLTSFGLVENKIVAP